MIHVLLGFKMKILQVENGHLWILQKSSTKANFKVSC